MPIFGTYMRDMSETSVFCCSENDTFLLGQCTRSMQFLSEFKFAVTIKSVLHSHISWPFLLLTIFHHILSLLFSKANRSYINVYFYLFCLFFLPFCQFLTGTPFLTYRKCFRITVLDWSKSSVSIWTNVVWWKRHINDYGRWCIFT